MGASGASSGDAAPSPADAPVGPVVVGGVGGSGTRVVAEIMRELGFFTGGDLNEAGDNLWFPFLCKNPRWEARWGSRGPAISTAVGIFERAMTGRLVPSESERRFIDKAEARSGRYYRHRRLNDDRAPSWSAARKASLLASRERYPSGVERWGWKEPTSHIYLPELSQHFGERLRFVLVIRNGLYMAHSHNQAQLWRYGKSFGVRPKRDEPSAAASLDYWIAANERAVALGERLGPNRFLVLRYDDLCQDPSSGVRQFLDFLELDPGPAAVAALEALPRRPSSSSQPAAMDVSDEQRAALEALGFPAGG